MSPLRRLLVAASFAAFSLPALANPVADAAGLHGPRIALRQGPAVVTTTAPGAHPTSAPGEPQCIAAGIPADREFSLYSFSVIMSQASREAADAAGLNTVAVRQHCDAGTGVGCSTTENWGMVGLDSYDPDTWRYLDVKVDRCKDGNSSYVHKYQILLCKGTDQATCEEFCGESRSICYARDGEGKILKSRVVDDKDDWTCAVPGA